MIGIVIGIIILVVVGYFMFSGKDTQVNSENKNAESIDLTKLSALEIKETLSEANGHQKKYDIYENSTIIFKGSAGPLTFDSNIAYTKTGTVNRETQEYISKQQQEASEGKTIQEYSLENGVMTIKITSPEGIDTESSQASFQDYDIVSQIINLLGEQQVTEQRNYYILKLNPELGKLLTAIGPGEYADFSGVKVQSELILSVNKASNLIEKAQTNAEFNENGMNSIIKIDYYFTY